MTDESTTAWVSNRATGADLGHCCTPGKAVFSPAPRCPRFASFTILTLCLGLAPFLTGCAAFRPLEGVPARHLQDLMTEPPRSSRQTIDLSLLRQTPPPQHLVDTNDVLGVYIEGVLGRSEDAPPVHFPGAEGAQGARPSVGFPIPVREDGTISLPLIEPLFVRGMTIAQVESCIRKAYTVDNPILKAGVNRIMINLQKPRTFRVLVIRQEAGNTAVPDATSQRDPYSMKRGSGQVVQLPAYKNDVLNALAETGGLPGTDAENMIHIIRRAGPPPQVPPYRPALPPHQLPAPDVLPQPGDTPLSATGSPVIQQASYRSAGTAWQTAPGHAPPRPFNPAYGPPAASGYLPEPASPSNSPQDFWGQWPVDPALLDPTVANPNVVKIPLRLAPGERPNITERDIILCEGDIVFIESRDEEVYYTGGLLGGGQYVLPRDYDLDILGAMAIAQGKNNNNHTIIRSIGGVAALNQDVTVGASDVIILRRLPSGQQISIKVDLYKAVRRPEERVLIQPGDYIVLQYTPAEACAAFFERHVFEGAFFGIAGAIYQGR